MSQDQGILDAFSRVDEYIRGDADSLLSGIKEDTHQLATSEMVQDGVLREGRPRIKRVDDLSLQLDAESEDSRVSTVPFDGWVTGFTCGWPNGADQNAGISLRHNEEGTKFFPYGDDEFAAFDGYNNTFPVTFPVEKGEKLKVVFNNTNNTAMPLNALINYARKFPEEELQLQSR